MGPRRLSEQERGATAPDEMVMVRKDVAEWAVHWHDRCETGRRATRFFFKWLLIIFGGVGTVSYGLVQLYQLLTIVKPGHP